MLTALLRNCIYGAKIFSRKQKAWGGPGFARQTISLMMYSSAIIKSGIIPSAGDRLQDNPDTEEFYC